MTEPFRFTGTQELPQSASAQFDGVYAGDPCCVCGRDVKGGNRVAVDLASNTLIDPQEWEVAMHQEQARESHIADAGEYPIGPDCLKKHGIKSYVLR